MISLVRDTANTVVVTLNEKATLNSPVFLFQFTNNETEESTTVIGTDVSSFKERYNKFTITESATEDRVNGTVKVRPDGIWNYTVYEQESLTNLDVTLATGIVETGRCYVTGTEEQLDTYTPAPATKPAYEKT